MTTTMPRAALSAAVLLAAFSATPAAASCADALAALDGRVKDEATKAVASSSSGQSVAAKRDQQAIESRDTKVPVTALPKAPAGGTAEAKTTAAAAEAGGAGDRVMQAKVTINDARVAKDRGDEAGCLEAVGKARKQLDD